MRIIACFYKVKHNVTIIEQCTQSDLAELRAAICKSDVASLKTIKYISDCNTSHNIKPRDEVIRE